MIKNKTQFFSLPNILSYIRILLIPFFTYLYFQGEYMAAALVVALSGLTDMADGMIARKFDMITEWGKFIDPVADKLTQAMLIFCLASRYKGMWVLVIIFFVKEITMGLAGLFMLVKKEKKLSGAKWFGKAATVVQFLAMTALFAFEMPDWVVNVLILTVAGFMIMAFVLYMRAYIKLNKE